jgi:hypothetical protein
MKCQSSGTKISEFRKPRYKLVDRKGQRSGMVILEFRNTTKFATYSRGASS